MVCGAVQSRAKPSFRLKPWRAGLEWTDSVIRKTVLSTILSININRIWNRTAINNVTQVENVLCPPRALLEVHKLNSGRIHGYDEIVRGKYFRSFGSPTVALLAGPYQSVNSVGRSLVSVGWLDQAVQRTQIIVEPIPLNSNRKNSDYNREMIRWKSEDGSNDRVAGAARPVIGPSWGHGINSFFPPQLYFYLTSPYNLNSIAVTIIIHVLESLPSLDDRCDALYCE